MYSVGLYTLGCKVSQYETEAVREEFERRGFEIRDFADRCDVYVINTCTVTQESDRKSRQFIRRAIKTNPDATVLVMGCYSQRAPKEVFEIDGVSCVIGTEDKLSLVSVAEKKLSERERGVCPERVMRTTDLKGACFEKMKITSAPRTRAYVKIEDGCESKCTYCAISKARGPVRSKLPEDVIDEVITLHQSGTREIVLTGIEIGSYGKDFEEKYNLADLIVALDRTRACERIRIGSLAPELVSDEFISKVKKVKILAPHFHLSVQSGSDSVLRGMKRRYNVGRVLNVIEKIRKEIPNAEFTADLMVGFPGESEENFRESLDFVEKAGFLDVHVFAYSRRDGTPACEYDGQIPENIKRERSDALIKKKNEVRDRVLDKIISSAETLSVIAETRDSEGYYTAHSDTYIETRFYSEDKNLSGEVVTVIPVSHKNGVVLCKIKE